jgi:hypothetical protein
LVRVANNATGVVTYARTSPSTVTIS